MAHGQSTRKEIVHALVLIAASGDQVVGLVPGVDGRSEKRSGQVCLRTGNYFLVSSALQLRRRPRSGLYAVSRINHRVFPGIDRTDRQRLKSIADAVSNILCPVTIAGSGGFRHQNADEARRDGRIRKLQMDISSAAA